MTISNAYVQGIAYESTYGSGGWTPASSDTFYRPFLEFEESWPNLDLNRDVQEIMSAASAYASSIHPGKAAVGRVLDGVLVNGIPVYLAFGSSSSAGDVHTITPSYSQPSFRFHYEERGGTEAIIHDILGCVVNSLSLTWDRQIDGRLHVGMGILGIQDRDDQDGSKPAVQLDDYPIWPP